MARALPHKPEWTIVRFFSAVIAVGTVLLCLPFASRTGQWTSPLTALFTATSATCVTGLTLVDTGGYFSRFGQLVILLLIQTGGLGIMLLGMILLIVVGRRLSLTDELVLMDALGTQRAFAVRLLVWRAVGITLALEAAGAVILAFRLATRHALSPAEAVFSGIFHAVSALCNAGFSLQADSLTGWREDVVLMLTVTVLILFGGLGFLVWHNLSTLRPWRRDRTRRGRLALHGRLAMGTSLILLAMSWLLFAGLEWNGVLQNLRWTQRLNVSLFQAVTPRTAGFSAVDLAALRPPAFFLTLVLMFIGGSPASMAGGIKTTTVAILLLVTLSFLRGREDVDFAHRKIPERVVRAALAIFVIGIMVIGLSFALLLIVERSALSSNPLSRSLGLLFETVSAFSTVGLSVGITPSLSPCGRLLITVVMFVGRLGPTTLALIIGEREVRQLIHCPEEEVLVG